MVPQNFPKQLLDATVQVFLAILKILLLPFNLWVKAVGCLSEHKEKGSLDLNNISGLWPFFTFCKRLFLDVVLDVIAFLAYPIGVIVAFFAFVLTFVKTPGNMEFGEVFIMAIAHFIAALLVSYLVPVYTVFINNFVQLFILLPLRKLIDWLKKPAQHLDVDSVQNVKVKKEE